MKNRIIRAATELQSNGSQRDNSVATPTGPAYKEREAKSYQHKLQVYESKSKHTVTETLPRVVDDADGDYELRLLREKRREQYLAQEQEKLSNIGKGHGQYREISQDEFLQEVTITW